MAEGGGFSLSLGTAKPAARKIKITEDDLSGHRELVIGIGQDGEVRGQARETGNAIFRENGGPLVIPSLGNDSRLLGANRKKERFRPTEGDITKIEHTSERFEVSVKEEDKTTVQYGLNIMRTNLLPVEENDAQTLNGHANGQENGQSDPHERSKKVVATKDWESAAYKEHVESLPDIPTLEHYEAMPVDAFGEAMLRGMGWAGPSEQEAQAVEYVRRPRLLGLGATPAMPTHDKKKDKDPKHRGRPEPEKKDLVVYDEQGNIKHTMKKGDKLVERRKEGPAEGKWMRVLKGQHEGLRCKVIKIHDKEEGHSQTCTIALYPSEKTVKVRLKELGEVDEKVEKESKHHKHSKKRKRDDNERGDQERNAEYRSFRDSHKYLDERAQDRNPREKVSEEERAESEAYQEPWLRPHIRVKVIDKKIGKGRYYLKKGEVTDVMSRHSCTVHLDSGERIDLEDGQIETSIPKKEGSRVLILLGPYTGQRAKMLQRSSTSSQAALQLTEDYTIVKLDFSEFAEYVGDIGEEE